MTITQDRPRRDWNLDGLSDAQLQETVFDEQARVARLERRYNLMRKQGVNPWTMRKLEEARLMVEQARYDLEDLTECIKRRRANG